VPLVRVGQLSRTLTAASELPGEARPAGQRRALPEGCDDLRPDGTGKLGARSFESLNFPGYYIRHTNFELWIARADGTALFKKDATYFIAPALTTHGPSGRID
jgi:hypothetical protein